MRDSAETGKPVAQLIRDLIDDRYFGDNRSIAGWHLTARVTRPVDGGDAPPPPRTRLREWLSRG